MGKGQIFSHIGGAQYSVTLIYKDKDRIDIIIAELQSQIDDLNDQIADLDEGPDKDKLELKVASLEKMILWYERNTPENPTIEAWCADLTEDLSGEVGTIEIPGERTIVMIRPGYDNRSDYSKNRDGQIQPVICAFPASFFLNLSIFPGWQTHKPTYRIGQIIADSMDFQNDTCSVCLLPAFSSQQSINVNPDADWSECGIDNPPGFNQFCLDNPAHPICTNEEQADPINLSDSQYQDLQSVNAQVNSEHDYQSDASGYGIGEYWAIMGAGDKGDCEDFALTKVQALIDSGWSPKNLQLAVCYTELGEGHAVLMIRTKNRGNLILDNRFQEVRNQSSLNYNWHSSQLAGTSWGAFSVQLENVPIEYMECNSAAFADGDQVVVEFSDLSLNNPKVIGFYTNPKPCEQYIFCAVGSYNSYTYGNLRYDVLGNSWIGRAEPQMPYSYGYWQYATALKYGQYGFVMGGYTAFFNGYNFTNEVLNICKYYNALGNAWGNAQSFSGNKRTLSGGFAISTKGYLVGGTYFPEIGPGSGPDDVFDKVDEINFSTLSWTVKNNYFDALGGCEGFAAANGKGYIIGGKVNDWLEFLNVIKSIREYNQAGDAWVAKTGMSGSRQKHAIFEVGGFGYVTGGWLKTSHFGSDDTPAVWYGDNVYITRNCQKYDHNADSWSTKQHQHNFTIDAYGIKNGINNKGFKTNSPLGIQIYDSVSDSWSASKDSSDDVGQGVPIEGVGFSA